MTLGKKQQLFMRLLPRLIDFIHESGYEIRGGDLFRDPRLHGELGVKVGYGHRNSAHKNKLAVDLNIFKNGKYLTATADHLPFGIFWESLDELCSWGGSFNDGNHYSLVHNGAR